MTIKVIKPDPAYAKVDEFASQMVSDVWRDKYRHNEETFEGMCSRVSNAIYAQDFGATATNSEEFCREAMKARMWMPAGRILAGAGTAKRVTLMNCFVNGKLEDSMESIKDGLGNTLLTMQQGGGIGTDFSPLRPPKAWLFRTSAPASGPGPFIDLWDAGCSTIKSAGDRRGAEMGTLICTHPYLPEFIVAKQQPGRWTNFNVSVLVTDAFMSAVAEDEEWYLHHRAEPDIRYPRDPSLVQRDFVDDEGVKQFVYSVWQARDLWDLILRSTYDYAEPGVIFIDQVNDRNNLNYCEDIQCTNPCGEQPLPPHGCCNLGAINLSRLVINPFSEDAEFNWDLLTSLARLGVRFLDNVIDVTNYPLEEQALEERTKRRIGLGVSGLADAMHQLGMRYGSVKSVKFAERVMEHIAIHAYDASSDLAAEKGTFPLYSTDILDRPFIKQLPQWLQDKIKKQGLRTGVSLTIAPTGTTSIAYGNGSSGLEPVFLHSTKRKVLQADNSFKEYIEYGYGARLWLALNPEKTIEDLPAHMNVCDDVRIHEHVRIQEVCQKWVDASISKTINLPTDISFEDFRDVYTLAYESGCKGCTTYRPSDVRGSILSSPDAVIKEDQAVGGGSTLPAVVERPEEVPSRTIKLRWPNLKSALYLTVGYVDGRPHEVFLNSKDQSAMEWMTSTTLLMSMVLRQGISLEILAEEFKQIHSLEGGWAESKYYPSLISYLGEKLKALVANVHSRPGGESEASTDPDGPFRVEGGTIIAKDMQVPTPMVFKPKASCKACGSYNVVISGGCPTCTDCGWSKCS